MIIELENTVKAEEPERTTVTQHQFSDFYSTKDLAKRVGKSIDWVEKWLPSKRLPGAVKIGGEWSFDRKSVDKRLPPNNLYGQFLLEPDHEPKKILVLHARKKSHGGNIP